MTNTDHRTDPVDPRELLHQEAEALVRAAERLDVAAFAKAVELLATTPGKAILTGAGTSGIIARKIAATLTSTGTPALFLHPGDALHGALGVVAEGDVVIAISNSGETGEVLGLLPYVRKRNVSVIALVGRIDSTLGRDADVALDAGVTREVCPFDLAPTASTTVALALGDALAVSLYSRRGMTPERFALNHPSGRLGRRLTLTVGDLMQPGDPSSAVRPGSAFLDVVSAVSRGGVGAVAVLDEQDHLAGLVTDGDLRRAIERIGGGSLEQLRAQDVMTGRPTSTGPETLAFEALRVMEDRPAQISVLPVVSGDGTFAGMVRVHDLVRAGL